ncbi:MAG: GNAT family N-acetyltransferase [Clostridiales bacterium]|jgi:GNAT superfamily N-acetyltransferase|nr:GNAT family N-acetyltransferase [Clostridiales bacterium]
MLLDCFIRSGWLEDLELIVALYEEAAGVMRREGIDQWDEIYPDRITLEQDLLRGEMFLLIKEQPLAAMTLSAYQDEEYSQVNWAFCQGRALVLHRLCISPAFWGRGLAGQMMDFAEQWGRDQGFSTLRLDTFTTNPRALRLYQSRGYHLAGQVLFRKGLFNCYEKKIRC